MKRAVAVVSILVLVTLSIGFALKSFSKAQNEPIWPMDGFNPQRTFQCPYDVSGNNLVWKWRFKTSTNYMLWFQPSIVIGSDKTIYIGEPEGMLESINPDGSLKWNLSLGWGRVSLAIGLDGTIYAASNSGFYAINPNGTIKWQYRDYQSLSDGSPVIISPDGIIYSIGSRYNSVNDTSLFAFNPDGTLKWKFDANFELEFISPKIAVATDGTVYALGDGYIYILNPDGSLKTKWNINASDIIIGPDGTIYLGWNGLTAMSPDGTIKWSNTSYSGPLACSSDGTIYTNVNGVLAAVNPDGTIKWKSSVGAQKVVIANNGYLISASLTMFDNQGNIVRKYSLLQVYFGNFVIGSDGTIYAYGNDGYLYALGNAEVTCPTAPQNLALTKVDGVIKLSWSPSTPGTYPVSGYAIFRSDDGIHFSFIDKTIDASTTTYTDYSATNANSTYYYYVVALDNRTPPDISEPSNIVSIGPPTFDISVNPSELTINQGSFGTVTVTLTSKYGFNSEVSLSLIGNPYGVNANFNPQKITPTETGVNSTLTLSVLDSATPGTYTITVRGVSGSINREAQIKLTITSSGVKKGDVNNDGFITAQDAILVLRYKAGYVTLTQEQLSAADMNNDGIVDEKDAQLILDKAVGL